jgi:hypothetical protein
METWKNVVGYEGVYSISNLGNVRRDAPSLIGRGISKPGRLIKPRKNGRSGYFQVHLCMNRIPTYRWVHRLVLEAFVGPAPTVKHIPNHIDGDKWNNAPENLEWVTQAENIAHARRTGLMRHWMIVHPQRAIEHGRKMNEIMAARGTRTRGSRSGQSKLTEEQVIQIRERYANKSGSYRTLGTEFGVDYTLIALIVQRKSWKHI